LSNEGTDVGREEDTQGISGLEMRGNNSQQSLPLILSSSHRTVVWPHKDTHGIAWLLMNKVGLSSPCRLSFSLIPVLMDEELLIVLSLKVIDLELGLSWWEGCSFDA